MAPSTSSQIMRTETLCLNPEQEFQLKHNYYNKRLFLPQVPQSSAGLVFVIINKNSL